MKPKPASRRAPSTRISVDKVESTPVHQEMTFKARSVKWFFGLIGSLLVAVVAWNQVTDRIDAHWQLKKDADQRDKDTAAELKAIKEKADADNKELARRAESGRAWLFFSFNDWKATSQEQWAMVCPAMKQSKDVCDRWKADAIRFQADADAAKRDAAKVGKDP